MRATPFSPLQATHGTRCAGLLGALLVTVLLGGCSTVDMVRNAQHDFDRALRREPASAFLAPVLARARGEKTIPKPTPQVRQHYFSIVAYLEGLTPEAQEQLRREGMLGEAFVLKALAQWRLGRLDRARESALLALGSRQEALDERERTLFGAMQGALLLEAGLDAVDARQAYPEVFALIAGPSGAWREFGKARVGVPRGAAMYGELVEARLASFKVLHEIRSGRTPDQVKAETDPERGAWSRLRAEAQIDLNDFASLPDTDPAAHANRVRQWQLACDLDLPSR